LWKDIQIRLTVIRPTFPVRAFEAPGALGCEKRGDMIRRSDSAAGWEYAEADGRAIAIQRLAGYDAQQTSSPFLDQSNINLAYPYAEQPTVHEAEARVAARCLAAASLIRPRPFDSAVEFKGIRAEPEPFECFRVTLPDGSSAFVAPGESTPKRINLNGHEWEGVKLRYAHTSMAGNELSGLGITRIANLVTFSNPATFRLKLDEAGTAHLKTNTGVSFADQCLRNPVHCVEARALDGQWTDITDQCSNQSIPPEVVNEWSNRNQRTLVEFRINA